MEKYFKKNNYIIIFLGAGFEAEFGVKNFEKYLEKYRDEILKKLNENDNFTKNYVEEMLKKNYNFFKKFHFLKRVEIAKFNNRAEIVNSIFYLSSSEKEEIEKIILENKLFKKFKKLTKHLFIENKLKIITTNLSDFLKIFWKNFEKNVLYLNKNENVFISEEDFFSKKYYENIEENFKQINEELSNIDGKVYLFFYGYSFNDILIAKKLRETFSDQENKEKFEIIVFNLEEEKNEENEFEKNRIKFNVFYNTKVIINLETKESVFSKFLEKLNETYDETTINNILDKDCWNKGIKSEESKNHIKNEFTKKDFNSAKLAYGDKQNKVKYFFYEMKNLSKEWNWKKFIQIIEMINWNYNDNQDWSKNLWNIVNRNKKNLKKNLKMISKTEEEIIRVFFSRNYALENIVNLYEIIFESKPNFLLYFDIPKNFINRPTILKTVTEFIIKKLINNEKTENEILAGFNYLKEEDFDQNKNEIWKIIKEYIEKNKTFGDCNSMYKFIDLNSLIINSGVFAENISILFIYEIRKKNIANYISLEIDYHWNKYDFETVDEIINCLDKKIKMKIVTINSENYWASNTKKINQNTFNKNYKNYWKNFLNNKQTLEKFEDEYLIKFILKKKKWNSSIIDDLFKNKKNDNIDFIFSIILNSGEKIIDYLLKKIDDDMNLIVYFSKYSIVDLFIQITKKREIKENDKYYDYFLNLINSEDKDVEFKEYENILNIQQFLNDSIKCKIFQIFRQNFLHTEKSNKDIIKNFINKIKWQKINLLIMAYQYLLEDNLEKIKNKINKKNCFYFFSFLNFISSDNKHKLIKNDSFWKWVLWIMTNKNSVMILNFLNISTNIILSNEEKKYFLNINTYNRILSNLNKNIFNCWFFQKFNDNKITFHEVLEDNLIKNYILKNKNTKKKFYSIILEKVVDVHSDWKISKEQLINWVIKNYNKINYHKLPWIEFYVYPFENFLWFLYENGLKNKHKIILILKKWCENNKNTAMFYESFLNFEKKLEIILKELKITEEFNKICLKYGVENNIGGNI